jgi:acetylornithine/succinyldiaminopimelate/putrescine aminotransferase
MSQHLMNTYARQPISFVKGEGVWLFDSEGNRYLDALAGVAVNGLGHAHPKLVKAISEQVSKMIHVSNIYQIAKQTANPCKAWRRENHIAWVTWLLAPSANRCCKRSCGWPI